MPIPEVNRIVNAFVMGVGETNADATVNVSFINYVLRPGDGRRRPPRPRSPKAPTCCSPSGPG